VILPNFLWKSGNPARPCRSSASKILWDDNFCSAISQSRELVWLRNLVVSVSPASRPLSPRKKLAQLHSTFLSTASTFLPNWNLLFVLQFLEIWTLCEARALGTSYADKAQGQLRRDNGFHHEVFHELTLVHREGKRRGFPQHISPATRHSRAGGNPGLFSAPTSLDTRPSATLRTCFCGYDGMLR
jgi:hypothetical protein